MTAIPRSVVATALSVPEDSLPDGDLPISRLAERYLAFLNAPEDSAMDGPDGWTFALVDALVRDHPVLAYKTITTALPLCDRPEAVSLLAAGPMEDLLSTHGAAFIDRIEADAAASPRFRYLLSGVWKSDIPALLWARVEAARAPGPDMDAGDPLPET